MASFWSCSTDKSRPLRHDLSRSKNFHSVLILAWLFWFLALLAITARLSGSRESLGLPIDQSGSRKDPKAQLSTYPHGNFLDDRPGPGILRDDCPGTEQNININGGIYNFQKVGVWVQVLSLVASSARKQKFGYW